MLILGLAPPVSGLVVRGPLSGAFTVLVCAELKPEGHERLGEEALKSHINRLICRVPLARRVYERVYLLQYLREKGRACTSPGRSFSTHGDDLVVQKHLGRSSSLSTSVRVMVSRGPTRSTSR